MVKSSNIFQACNPFAASITEIQIQIRSYLNLLHEKIEDKEEKEEGKIGGEMRETDD